MKSLKQILPHGKPLEQRVVIRKPNPIKKDTIVRNAVGVQLLSRRLHRQIFKNTSFPPPDPAYVRISREHLADHNLNPTHGSVLPDIGFTLPPLQGPSIDSHFHAIGVSAAEPSLSLAKSFASQSLPPKPQRWVLHPGWTKYTADGPDVHVHEHVESIGDEEMLCFDIETMPKYHNFAILACAASADAWYCWISPWILGYTTETEHLIPIGDRKKPRIIVGHNISYDRARILEEYHIERSQNRFVDTLALHVAVKGISSHQRPAWMKYKKNKQEEKEMNEESVAAVVEFMEETDRLSALEKDQTKRSDLKRLRKDLEESLPLLQDNGALHDDIAKRWEEITSANSLADVARLHCKIEVSKETRNDFMTCTPDEIRENLDKYIDYCAEDVSVTHAVFSSVLPPFLMACPSPVSWAGAMVMGNSFLTVNESWKSYIHNAESKFKELESSIKEKLLALTEEAKEMMHTGEWKNDAWLSQLDWSPKTPGKSRGFDVPAKTPPKSAQKGGAVPTWYHAVKSKDLFAGEILNRILPFLFRIQWNNFPIYLSARYGWVSCAPVSSLADPSLTVDAAGDELLSKHADPLLAFIPLPSSRKGFPLLKLLGKTSGSNALKTSILSTPYPDLVQRVCEGERSEALTIAIRELADQRLADSAKADVWAMQLDWTPVRSVSKPPIPTASQNPTSDRPATQPPIWPKWYWDLAKPKPGQPPGTIDVTVRSRLAPLMLRLSWFGWPIFHSREHGWTFRVPRSALPSFQTRQKPIDFYDLADEHLREYSIRGGFAFFKLPHKDGEKANVGNPLGKTFVNYFQDGTLTSPEDSAKAALEMNAKCSYWISARDRVMNQMVVWEKQGKMGINQEPEISEKKQTWGMIIPQVISMGTVTRRAIENTWLTASNAKQNRVGSELKAMVRAPPGYAIVGADVDSEELWISSVMGDAQFGIHGATAIGWMTLEGTKAAGTDLHSKTANILGISRDQAKVFNYSRIYGAGMKHAVLLLLQSNAAMLPEKARTLSEELYASTKGKNTHRTDLFDRKFWYGGTESFLFNKLEAIAVSDHPQTPALDCRITYALSKEYLPAEFGSDYMTSRINWVVQSSGVDYLHLLIVAMEYLISKYDIKARYLISVHDELRYLVKEEDKYRASLALQIANLWTRCLFAYKLGMDDLPQGVAFFSAVDVDTVLRKEVDMTCVTPSQPTPLPPGQSLNIAQALEATGGGSLWRDQRPMEEDNSPSLALANYKQPDCLAHRAPNAAFLRAQATTEMAEIRMLAKSISGKKYPKKVPRQNSRSTRAHLEEVFPPLAWDTSVEAEVLRS